MVHDVSDALQQARVFVSKVTGPLASEEEQRWLISTVHALDHTAQLAKAIEENTKIDVTLDSPDERRAAALCAEARRSAVAIASP